MENVKVKEEVYIILLKYFQGDMMNITVEKVKNIKKGVFNGQPIKAVDKSVIKVFSDVLRLKLTEPKKYASKKWIYPDWDKEEKEKQLRNAFPEDYEDEPTEHKVKTYY